MKILKTSSLFVLIASLVLLAACSKDDDPQVIKSGDKSITVFKLSGLTPEVVGTISESTHQISVSVPRGTVVTSLVPAIEISEKATLNPASGTAQNFTNPVTYTVTAEDGTTQEYVVTVTPGKSPEKKITSFKFAGLAAEVIATITESNHKIRALVPYGTAVTSLIPTIEVSLAATISPSSGTAKNFTGPVTYTVIAEDGTTQEYEVTVVIDFTLSQYSGLLEVERKELYIIDGTGFGNDHTKNKLRFINTTTQAVTDLPALSSSSNYTIDVLVPATLELGIYKIEVFAGDNSKVIETEFKVINPWIRIISLNKTTVTAGENMIITGKYFNASGNEVTLVNDEYLAKFTLEIIAESETSITVKVPFSVAPYDEYSLVVNNGDMALQHTEFIKINASAKPHITSTDKTSYTRGETITITGQNLKKIGFATNINFTPFTSGVTQMRSGIANSGGTQVTFVIPGDFTTGTYILVIEVDGEYSEEYDEVIQINP